MSSLQKRLQLFNSNRQEDLLKYKYTFMKENVFRFYRGTCHLFYEDLAKVNLFNDAPATWISGDLHIENFGTYKGENRLVYFDLNDFDEAVIAPCLWEVARFVTSIFVAFKTLRIERKKAEKLSQLYIENYSSTLQNGKALYIERQIARGIVGEFLEKVNRKNQKNLLSKKTVEASGKKLSLELKYAKHKKLDKHTKKELILHFQKWLANDENSPYNYKVTDCAVRIAGTGSVGQSRYVLLLKSSNDNGVRNMLIDMKQTVDSSLAPFVSLQQPNWKTNGERIIKIQKRMQLTLLRILK